MMRVLAVNDYYLPGFRGGTIRALATIADRLGDRCEFWIVTGDRDVGQPEPYAGVDARRWVSAGRARVRYLAPPNRSWRDLRALVTQVAPDLIFTFSVFSPLTIRLLALHRLGLLGGAPILVAPEGEFSPGALAQKAAKKRLFLAAARATGLYRNVTWKATSELEAGDIRRTVGPAAVVHLAPSLPPRGPAVVGAAAPGIAKRPGHVRFVYLSRVTPKKNLHFAIEQLEGLRGDVVFDVVGPIEDARYWASCQFRADALGANVQVHALGDVQHERVFAEFAARHFLVLPTLGENFGFVILEALASGRPVVVSQETPWRGLAEAGAGWDLPLADAGAWHRTLQACVDMDEATYQRMSRAAWQYARDYAGTGRDLEAKVMAAFEDTARRRTRPAPQGAAVTR